MAESCMTLHLDRGHTGGRLVVSDIVVPWEVLPHLFLADNDDGAMSFSDADWDMLDEDDEEGFAEVEDEDFGAVWIWRGNHRKG